MENVEKVLAAVKEINELLDEPHLEPNPERSDWGDVRAAVDGLKTRIDDEILEPMKAALTELEDPDDREGLRAHGAVVVGETGVVLHASGKATEGQEYLTKAVAMAPKGAVKDEMQAGVRDTTNYIKLILSRWLLRQGDRGGADKLAKEVQQAAIDTTLKEGAKQILDAPRPISSAPGLFTLNGFGTGLYGHRDEHPDGSYVATYALCALFIPVFPLTAYRVIDQGNSSYLFLAKEKLSGFARGYRNLLFVSILALIGTSIVGGYMRSPERLSRIAVAEAAELEEAGDSSAALQAYEEALQSYDWGGDRDALQTAGARLFALYSAAVPAPLTLDGVEPASRALSRFAALPSAGRDGEARELVGTRVLGWADDLGQATSMASRASIRLLRQAEDATSGSTSTDLSIRRVQTQIALADTIAPSRPLAALAQYLAVSDQQAALDKAAGVIESLGKNDSLWVAAGDEIRAWADGRDGAEVAKVLQRLGRAETAAKAPARQKLLRSKNIKAVTNFLKKNPRDQGIAAHLAGLQRSRGNSEAALATLEKLGKPGWLIPEAQFMLGALYSDTGRLTDAESVLDPYLAGRLDGFRQAQRAYFDKAKSVREALIRKLEYGQIPAALQAEIDAASDEQRQRIFVEWLASETDKDATLAQRREVYESYADVAPACLTLGMVKLRRANSVGGAEKAKLLGDAERAFLAIREEVEGLPTFHLGLGQVYYRLGRETEGDAELDKVMNQGDPDLELAVARTYRELGKVGRAREVATAVYERGIAPHHHEAASTLAMMAIDLDDEENWLKRADTSSPFIKTGLTRIRGERMFRDGKHAEAEKAYAQVARVYGKQAQHNSAAANNAALMHQRRYLCTGNTKLLDEGIKGLEGALRLAPDNALVIGNLAQSHAYAGTVRVLDGWLKTDLLRVDGQEANELLAALAAGPMHAEVKAAMVGQASLQRSAQLTQQEEMLAPNRPSAYQREANWLGLRRDLEALQVLETRLNDVKGFDNTQRDEMRAAFESGADDERFVEELDASIRHLDHVRGGVEKKKHAPTLAAWHFLRGLRLRDRAQLTGESSDAEAAVAELRKANKAWPKLDEGRQLAWALVELAFIKAARTSEPVKSFWRENRRKLGLSVLLSRLREGGGEALAAMRKQAELGAAVALRRVSASERPTLADWALAHVSGDAAFGKVAAGVFERTEERVEAAISLRLDPTSENHRAMLELLQKGN